MQQKLHDQFVLFKRAAENRSAITMPEVGGQIGLGDCMPNAKNPKENTQAVASKIIRRKLSDQVFDRLSEMIEAGDFKPGQLMPSERELMEQFGVGRPAVREALQQMNTLGLITIAQGGRARVNKLSTDMVIGNMDGLARLLLSASPKDLEHLKQARRMFEMGMVRIAAETATVGDIADLRHLIEKQRAALSDANDFIRGDIEFHLRITQISANPIFLGLSDAMLGWLFNYHSDLLRWSGKEKTTLAEHCDIVDAIEGRDADQAIEAMRAHLDRSTDLYRHPG